MTAKLVFWCSYISPESYNLRPYILDLSLQAHPKGLQKAGENKTSVLENISKWHVKQNLCWFQFSSQELVKPMAIVSFKLSKSLWRDFYKQNIISGTPRTREKYHQLKEDINKYKATSTAESPFIIQVGLCIKRPLTTATSILPTKGLWTTLQFEINLER